jgi:hypothetical protein
MSGSSFRGPLKIRKRDGSKVTIADEDGNLVAELTAPAGSIGTAELADGSITAAKVVGSQSVTATADGLTTGLITAPTSMVTFVTVTSAAATNAVTLPAASAAGIGNVFYLTVGANGYELVTTASGNNTINTVDSDGTNQLDVAATTTVRVTQISATAFLAETIAATTIAVTAPDND